MQKTIMWFVTVVVLVCLLSALAPANQAVSIPPNIRITNYPELNNEEQVWICPTDPNIIIANWRDFRLGYRQIGIGRSIDGGLTWSDSLISVGNQYFLFDSYQSDPTLTVDADGNFYMSVLDYDAVGITGYSIVAFYKSTDKGLTWTGPVPNISVLSADLFEDKQFITVDRTGGTYNGNLYCSWTRFPNPDRIMFVRSINGGASFEDTVIVGPSQTSTGCGSSIIDAGQFSIPIVTSNGNVHVLWMGYALDSAENCTGQQMMKHSVSTDGGATFSYEDVVVPISGYQSANGGINTYSNPVGDADIFNGPFDGNLYIAYANIGPEDGGRTDIDFIKSSNNGITWTNRIQINDYKNSSVCDAFHPWMVVNEEGVIVTIFYTNRYDEPSHYLFDVVAAYSFDGGETFTTNHRISSVSSSPGNLFDRIPPQLEWPEFTPQTETPVMSKSKAGLIGEYIGVSANYDKLTAVWTDSRDGNSEVYNANWTIPLLEPRLLSPLEGDTLELPVTCSWATSWKNDFDRYRMEFSINSDFSANVESVVNDTNFTNITSLTDYGMIYWRAKTFDIISGDSSAYSAIDSFYIEEPYMGCCIGVTGNINGDVDDLLDISDRLYMVDYFFEDPAGPAPVCWEEADVDGSGSVDISDLLYLVDYFFAEPGGPPPLICLF